MFTKKIARHLQNHSLAVQPKMPEIRLQFPTAHQEHKNTGDDVHTKLYSVLEAHWTYLPHEVWLKILVDYGVAGRDLVNLDYTCKWFSNCWGCKYTIK